MCVTEYVCNILIRWLPPSPAQDDEDTQSFLCIKQNCLCSYCSHCTFLWLLTFILWLAIHTIYYSDYHQFSYCQFITTHLVLCWYICKLIVWCMCSLMWRPAIMYKLLYCSSSSPHQLNFNHFYCNWHFCGFVSWPYKFLFLLCKSVWQIISVFITLNWTVLV